VNLATTRELVYARLCFIVPLRSMHTSHDESYNIGNAFLFHRSFNNLAKFQSNISSEYVILFLQANTFSALAVKTEVEVASSKRTIRFSTKHR